MSDIILGRKQLIASFEFEPCANDNIMLRHCLKKEFMSEKLLFSETKQIQIEISKIENP